MDERSLKALEFDRIRDAVAAYAFSSLGVGRARAMVPDAARAPSALAEVAEMTAYVQAAPDYPLAGISDIAPLLKRLAAEGALVGAELVAIRDCLTAAARAKRAFHDAEAFPHLSGYAAALEPLRELADQISRQLDDDGAVRDDATPRLAALRKQLAAQREEITASFERLLNNATVRRALRDAIVTQRGGRYVLPVRTDAMGSVRGIVHGHSSSGVTAFVEPMSLVELNNKLEVLLAEEEAEVERILRALSYACAQESDALAADLEVLEELDFIAARTGFGLAYRCRVPALVDDPVLALRDARHPLLLASRAPAEVVPVSFELGAAFAGVVISGPNNGGKTVALKTAGLLAAMALAGVPLPAEEGTVVGSFGAILADIGDESSIEGNLSTFTAHMANVRRFLEVADGRTLVLLDELGVGTSPKYGVAIATAVLRRLRAADARVVVTTHYDELKTFAQREGGFVNAAVEIDPATLAPTYTLKFGRPGTSEAFAILGRLGFPEDVIGAATAEVGAEETSLADLIRAMEEREAAAARCLAELETARGETARREEALAAEVARQKSHAARVREDAYAEATKVLRDARRQAALIIRELREEKDLARAEELRRQLRAAEEAAAAVYADHAVVTAPGAGGEIAVGGWASVRGTKAVGEVAEIDDRARRARLRFGGVEVWVDLADLVAAPAPARRGGAKAAAGGDVSAGLNLIGFRVEDALVELERYLDRAAVARLPGVEIVHGYGTGRLRDGIRRFLRTHPAVASFGAGPGGNEGVTVVQLKT